MTSDAQGEVDGQPALFNNMAGLLPGTYTATIIGFSGWLPTPTQGLTVTNNISGPGITGTIYSMNVSTAPVAFTLQ